MDAIKPAPEGLFEYEQQFLQAFAEKNLRSRRKLLQQAMINLIVSVAQKMKGFSRKETLEYYRGIVDRAWQQVEPADTPEVKSQKFDEVMEWTMLDKDYDRRTRDVFQSGPVYVPAWWGRYDPSFGRGAPSTTTVATPSPSGGVSLPHLPGSDFAASVVNGVQNFSAGVVGNLTEFTTGVVADDLGAAWLDVQPGRGQSRHLQELLHRLLRHRSWLEELGRIALGQQLLELHSVPSEQIQFRYES